MRMRVLLLGRESLLGQSLVQQAAAEDIEFLQVDEAAQWLPDAIDGWLDALTPDAVIDLAHYHQQFQLVSVDEARVAAHQAFAERLIDACAQRELLLCMLSNTRVYDGAKSTAYTEKDELRPIGTQGAAQAALDHHLAQRCPRHLLLRFSWLLDGSAEGMLMRLVKQLQAAQKVELAEEWRGNPTPVADAARVLLAVIKQSDCESQVYGVYHYGSAEVTSWISLAMSLGQELRGAHRLHQDPIIEPVAYASQAAARYEPQNAALNGRRLLHVFGIKPRAWRAGLSGLLTAPEA
ncbi:MAG: sugar nucleotide-binding protein [Halopseudomonas sp.]|uniref:sugar nucleotide-binding protein n=1 Tax=Halopseudomonas sp. TaxID=2901191 RepID=UPI003003095A